MNATPVSGRRFGLTADTHDDLCDWPAVLAKLRAAWGEVDGIFHCGDVSTAAALAGLAELAPVFATRNGGDPPPAPPLLTDGPRVLELEGVCVGLVFTLPEDARTSAAAARFFGRPVAACVHGGTHAASITHADGILFVNPGSPSLAKTRTAAILTLEAGRPRASIVEIG